MTEAAEGLELRKDGTVVAHIDGSRHVLRRPKIGELKKLRERYEGLSDEQLTLDEAVEVAAEALSAITERVSAGEKVPKAKVIAARARLREARHKAEEITPRWLDDVFALLSDAPLPSEDDRPAWFYEPKLYATFVAHWRTVPLVRGEP